MVATSRLTNNGKGIRYVIGANSSAGLVLRGLEDVTTWDDVELMHGRRFDKNGFMSGMPPTMVPHACHVELMRRRSQAAMQTLVEGLAISARQLVMIAAGESIAQPEQVKAIQVLMDRVMGKAKQSIEITPKLPWQNAAEAMDEDDAEDNWEEDE